jgi:predicted GNAT family acetyltransferase
MNPLDYLQLQLQLEGKGIVRDNLLRQVEVVPDEKVPLMLIARLADEDQALVHYFDESLQIEIRKELIKRVSEISFPTIDPLTNFLQHRDIAFECEHYKTYIFPKEYSFFKDENVKHYSKHDPKIEGFDAERIHAIEQDDKIVSTCVSSRENEFCGEAWVYTLPQYRNRGYAQKVVSAWAASLMKAGKIPFYSHKIQNNASSHLAKRLGLQTVFEEAVISHANV